jgi:hypothetical protein
MVVLLARMPYFTVHRDQVLFGIAVLFPTIAHAISQCRQD